MPHIVQASDGGGWRCLFSCEPSRNFFEPAFTQIQERGQRKRQTNQDICEDEKPPVPYAEPSRFSKHERPKNQTGNGEIGECCRRNRTTPREREGSGSTGNIGEIAEVSRVRCDATDDGGDEVKNFHCGRIPRLRRLNWIPATCGYSMRLIVM